MLAKAKSSNGTKSKADALPKDARHLRFLPLFATGAVVAVAGLLAWAAWDAYMETPWTRDGVVRAYVITETPEVSGKIINLPVMADQYVHKGDLLMEIDPANYQIAVDNAEAAVAQAKADLDNKRAEATRRLKLTTLAVTQEEQETYVARAQSAEAIYNQNLANLAQARINLNRTRIVSPVNGYVTNLSAQEGDYATAGQRILAVVNSESFWVDGYFEETVLGSVQIGDAARVALMGRGFVLKGHVVGIAHGISVPNAQTDASGLATVNPIFTWIRLAQRVPVRIALDDIPTQATLPVGLTATVEIDTHLTERNRR
jgi:multidrug resistance efflux pump